MEVRLKSIDEINNLVKVVYDKLLEKKTENRASVLALHGDLGAGKTTFMQHFAKDLGVEEVVTSPTFVVMKKYELPTGDFKQLVHIDAYRIEELSEMGPLGFGGLLNDQDLIICIEWAENISDLLPEETVHINIEIVGDDRLVKIDE